MVLAGRTNDPENVGAELLRLLGGNAAAVRKGIRKTDETPPRYAIPDTIEMVKGPVNLSQELNRLRERYPDVFEKELDRLRKLYEVRVPNWYPNFGKQAQTSRAKSVTSAEFQAEISCRKRPAE